MSKTTKRKTAKDKLRNLVEQNVSVLDEEHGSEQDPIGHTIENPDVRLALQRNRQYGDLPLGLIEPDPDQVRHVNTEGESFLELVDSIREHGVIEPITVRWLENRDVFQIITGERRFRAARENGLETIPAIVRDLSDTTKAIHQLVENIQRENMNPIEEAKAFRRYLAATGQERQELARQIGKSKSYVSQVMSLLENLTVEEQETLASVSPAKLPGKSLILEAVRADDREIRAAILRGELTRTEARKKIQKEQKPNSAGRKKYAAKTFNLDEPEATVTVRLKSPSLDEAQILQALHQALNEQSQQLANKAEG